MDRFIDICDHPGLSLIQWQFWMLILHPDLMYGYPWPRCCHGLVNQYFSAQNGNSFPFHPFPLPVSCEVSFHWFPTWAQPSGVTSTKRLPLHSTSPYLAADQVNMRRLNLGVTINPLSNDTQKPFKNTKIKGHPFWSFKGNGLGDVFRCSHAWRLTSDDDAAGWNVRLMEDSLWRAITSKGQKVGTSHGAPLWRKRLKDLKEKTSKLSCHVDYE